MARSLDLTVHDPLTNNGRRSRRSSPDRGGATAGVARFSRPMGLRNERGLPRRSGRRGGVDGAVVVVGVVFSSSCSSPELLAASVSFGRG